MNREHEVFGPGVVLGTIVSVIGALILSMRIDFVRSILPASPGLAALLDWRWP
jgi:hypothetical protein